MSRTVLVALLVLVWNAGISQPIVEAGPMTLSKDDVQVTRDDEELTTRITLTLHDGRIAWRTLIQSVAEAARLDAGALDGHLPRGSLDLSKSSSRLTLAACNVLLRPDLHMRQVTDPKSNIRQLEITLDRRHIDQRRQEIEKKLQRLLTRRWPGSAPDKYGLRWQPGVESKLGEQTTLVVVVHGFQSAPSALSGLVEAVTDANLLCVAFAYPNDQRVIESAKQLSSELKSLHQRHPSVKIDLVTHSMGGLVARSVVEDPKLDPQNIRSLIMIAPPNRGSMLARLSWGADVWEQLLRPDDFRGTRRLFTAVQDGLAGAAKDLRPGSPFLHSLNARPRNANLRYAILLGTRGPLSDEQLRAARSAVDEARERSKSVRLLGPKIEYLLSDLDEVVRGKGDGIVAVKRGRLEGVADTRLLDFGHLEVGHGDGDPRIERLYQEVIARLQRDR